MSDDLIQDCFEQSSAQMARLGFRSTSVFYSNAWLTLKNGDFYIVGLNPAGAMDHESQTGRSHLAKVQKHDKPWSAYVDESWSGQGLKTQKAVIGFANEFLPGQAAALGSTFSTNAIFARTPETDDLMPRLADVWGACWEWHLKFLEIVRPKVIVALGNNEGAKPSAYSLIRGQLLNPHSLGLPIHLDSTFSVKAAAGVLQLPSGNQEVKLVGLPHPSRRNLRTYPDAVAEIRKRGWLTTAR